MSNASESEPWLRLIRMEQEPRSVMATRAGQQAARERVERLWTKELARRQPQIRPLKWKAGGER